MNSTGQRFTVSTKSKPRSRSQLFENRIHVETGKPFPNPDEPFLTSGEAAEYLRISVKALYNLTSNGTIRPIKFRRRNRFLKSELKKLLLAPFTGGSN